MAKQLTNQQIEDALAALQTFKPDANLEAKLRLNRNFRKLQVAWREKESDREMLLWSAMSDQTKRPEANSNTLLSPEEQRRFKPELRTLMQKQVEVEIHPLEFFDSREGETPKEPKFAIDAAKLKEVPEELGVLLEVGILVRPDSETSN
ncbi:MAG TPA: hypothetical protein VEH27_11830 [Methylomirabilota bacterium]|nr:hypothetical protein [Methylomirabilota bacterium]